jgi:hypothetical protein
MLVEDTLQSALAILLSGYNSGYEELYLRYI